MRTQTRDIRVNDVFASGHELRIEPHTAASILPPTNACSTGAGVFLEVNEWNEKTPVGAVLCLIRLVCLFRVFFVFLRMAFFFRFNSSSVSFAFACLFLSLATLLRSLPFFRRRSKDAAETVACRLLPEKGA